MSKKKEVFRRLSVSDFVVTSEDNERMQGYAKIYDQEGNLITETEIYLIGYEFEDGEECNEDGTEL